MRSPISATLFLLAALHLARVLAQTTPGIGDLPSCSRTCTQTAATAAGCSVTDIPCLCNNRGFSFAVIQCSRSFCSSSDQTRVGNVLGDLCALFPSTSPVSIPSTPTLTSTTTGSESSVFTIQTSLPPSPSPSSTSSNTSSSFVITAPTLSTTPSTTQTSTPAPATTTSAAGKINVNGQLWVVVVAVVVEMLLL